MAGGYRTFKGEGGRMARPSAAAYSRVVEWDDRYLDEVAAAEGLAELLRRIA